MMKIKITTRKLKTSLELCQDISKILNTADLEALTEGLYGLGFLLEDLNLFGR